MKKRILSLALVVSLILVAVAGATMAYFTDTEQAVNIATIGNVSIKQHELQRVDGINYNNNGEICDGDELEVFEQGQALYPAYPENGGASYTAKLDNADQFWWGDYVTGDVSGNGSSNGLWGDDLHGAMDKFVFVENDGASACYYRTWIALECPEGMEFSEGSDKDFMVNINGNNRFTWSEYGHAVIDGTRYLIMCATYNIPLESGTISRPSLLQVVMTHHVTNEKAALLNGTYEILVFSQAVQVENFPDAETALTEAFGNDIPWTADYELPTIVRNVEELDAALTAAGAAQSGNTEIMIIDDIDASGYDWTPISVDGYHGAGVVTVYGNNKTITGLSAPLFAGGFAGKSGIKIYDLTIADSKIESDSTLGAGAFIATADSMQVITLSNCHLVNSSVLAPEARTGGLLGWASGYSNQSDGPVKTYITIENCSVVDCELTGTAIGGIAGHPGASDWTWTTISNPIVVNTVMTSTDDGGWRVGDVVGTANNGHIVINNAITGDNTKTMPNSNDTIDDAYHALVGRFVPSGTGTLEINGVQTAYSVSTDAEMEAALKSGDKNIVVYMNADVALNVSDAYIKLGGADTETITVYGNGNKFTWTTSYWSRVNTVNPNATIVLNDMTLTSTQPSGTWDSYDLTFCCNVELNNVVAEKAIALEGKKSVLNNVTINETHDYYALWIVADGSEVVIDGLTVNSAGRGIKISEEYLGGKQSLVTLSVSNSTFNTAKKAAILVGSTTGADITVSNLDLSGVADDTVNAVWVDEDWAAYAANVTVNGGTCIVEP